MTVKNYEIEKIYIYIAINKQNQELTNHLVPRRLVRKPRKTERINFPKEAAFTGSNLCSEQCLR